MEGVRARPRAHVGSVGPDGGVVVVEDVEPLVGRVARAADAGVAGAEVASDDLGGASFPPKGLLTPTWSRSPFTPRAASFRVLQRGNPSAESIFERSDSIGEMVIELGVSEATSIPDLPQSGHLITIGGEPAVYPFEASRNPSPGEGRVNLSVRLDRTYAMAPRDVASVLFGPVERAILMGPAGSDASYDELRASLVELVLRYEPALATPVERLVRPMYVEIDAGAPAAIGPDGVAAEVVVYRKSTDAPSDRLQPVLSFPTALLSGVGLQVAGEPTPDRSPGDWVVLEVTEPEDHSYPRCHGQFRLRRTDGPEPAEVARVVPLALVPSIPPASDFPSFAGSELAPGLSCVWQPLTYCERRDFLLSFVARLEQCYRIALRPASRPEANSLALATAGVTRHSLVVRHGFIEG